MMWVELTSIYIKSVWCELYCEFLEVRLTSQLVKKFTSFVILNQNHAKKDINSVNNFVKHEDI
jgi:hypothetical protein